MSSSDDSSADERGFFFPSTNPEDEEFEVNPRKRKRRKTGRDAKESAALGIFGSESDDDAPNKSWKQKTLRSRGVGFVQSHDLDPNELDQVKVPNASESDGSDEREETEADRTSEEQTDDTAPLADHGIPQRAYARAFKSSRLGQDDGWSSSDRQPSGATIKQPLGAGTAYPADTMDWAATATPVQDDAHTKEPPANSKPMLGDLKSRHVGNQGRASKSGGMKSFGAKMLGKMGYVEGSGLGPQGQGIVNPIEQKLRPMGAGLGVVREKTQQAKEEDKRSAAARGERYIDSSEEERKRKKERKLQAKSKTNGHSTSNGVRPKLRYRTATEIAASAEGLQIPNVLSSLIDATGRESKVLTSTHGLMVQSSSGQDLQTEKAKVSARARRDLEAFATEWTNLTDRSKLADTSLEELDAESTELQNQVGRLHQLRESMMVLQHEEQDRENVLGNQDGLIAEWSALAQRLETVSELLRDMVDIASHADVLVSLAAPLLRSTMELWESTEQSPAMTVAALILQQSADVLQPSPTADELAIVDTDSGEQPNRLKNSSSSYEAMMHAIWLPRMRRAVAEAKNLYQATQIIAVLEEWREIVPDFVLRHLMDKAVMPKLIQDLQKWSPNSNSKRSKRTPPPHIWIFPWLQYASPEHMDLANGNSLLSEVRRKIRKLIDVCDLEQGVPEGLDQWEEVLASELEMVLIRHLLPRLSRHLATELRINPTDQDLHQLEVVFKWTAFIKPAYFGQLLSAQFFPQWHRSLKTWLLAEQADHHEIDQWFDWWTGDDHLALPEEVLQESVVRDEFNRGLITIYQAIDGGKALGSGEPIPEPQLPQADEPPNHATVEAGGEDAQKPAADMVTIRDVLDHLCAEENLRQVALQEADPVTGSPLWRLTASASGRGGIIIRIEEECVYVRDRERRSGWRPASPQALMGLLTGA